MVIARIIEVIEHPQCRDGIDAAVPQWQTASVTEHSGPVGTTQHGGRRVDNDGHRSIEVPSELAVAAPNIDHDARPMLGESPCHFLVHVPGQLHPSIERSPTGRVRVVVARYRRHLHQNGSPVPAHRAG